MKQQQDEVAEVVFPGSAPVLAPKYQQHQTSQMSADSQSKKIISLDAGRNGRGPVQAFEMAQSPYAQQDPSQLSSSMIQQPQAQSQSSVQGGNTILTSTIPAYNRTQTQQQHSSMLPPQTPLVYHHSNSYKQSTRNQSRPTYARRHSAHSKNQSAVMKRPKSASHQQHLKNQSDNSHSIQFAQNNSQHYGVVTPQQAQTMLVHISPQKVSQTHKKTVQKMMPTSPKQSKEDLYAQALNSKMEANSLREENLRLATRMQFVENKLTSTDASGHINMLLKQLRMLKQKYSALSHEFKSQQSMLKTTQVNETRAENELYKQELTRLRSLLETEFNAKIQDFRNVPTMGTRDNSQLEVQSQNKQQSDLELKLRSLRKANTDQSKRILSLTDKLKTIEQTHQAKLRSVQLELQNTRHFNLSQEVPSQLLQSPTQQTYQTQQDQEQALQAVREEHHVELSIAKQQRITDLKKLQDGHVEEIQNIKVTNESEIQYLNEVSDSKILEMKEKAEQMQKDHALAMEDKEASLKHLVTEHERLIDDHKETSLELKQLKDLSSTQQVNFEFQRRELNDKCQCLQSSLQTTQSNLDKSESKIEESQKILEEKQGVIQEVKSRLDDLQTQQKVWAQTMHRTQEERDTLKAEKEELERREAAIRMRLNFQESSMRKMLDDLNEELEQKNRDIEIMAEKVQAAKESQGDDSGKVEEVQKERDAILMRLNFTENKMRSMQDDLNEEVDAKTRDVEFLQKKIEDMKTNNPKVQELELQNISLKKKFDQSAEQHQMMSQELHRVSKQNEELFTTNEKLRLQCQDLKLQIDDMHSRSLLRKPQTTDYGRKVTTNIDETFDRGETISMLPSPRQSNHSSYNVALEDREPFADDRDNDDSSDQHYSEERKQEAYPIDVEGSGEDRDVQKSQLTSLDQQRDDHETDSAEHNLQSACNAVRSLEADLIAELQMTHNPTLGIALVMDAVMMLLNKPTGWPNIKEILKDASFLKQVVELDLSQVTSEILSKIEMYTKHAAFASDKLMTQSTAAAVLCIWVKAVETLLKARPAQEPLEEEEVVPQIMVKLSSTAEAQRPIEFVQKKDIKPIVPPLQTNLQQPPEIPAKLRESFKKIEREFAGVTDFDGTCVPLTSRSNQLNQSNQSNRSHQKRQESQPNLVSPTSQQNKELTPEDSEIKDCLYRLKRACQVNYVRFDQIENFIFGDEYRPEVRIQMTQLSCKLMAVLKLQLDQATVFATYLVGQGQQSATAPVSPTTKVLQCRVVTLLIQNLNMYCQGVTVYSKKKEKKMKLIIGDAMKDLKSVYYSKWEHFAKELAKVKIEKETLDSAFVYCLRMSGSFLDVDDQTISDFIAECKDDAFSHTRTGKQFPIQVELLDKSRDGVDSEEPTPSEDEQPPISEELNDRHSEKCETTQLDVQEETKEDRALVSGSFDSGRDDDDDDYSDEDQQEPPVHEVVPTTEQNHEELKEDGSQTARQGAVCESGLREESSRQQDTDLRQVEPAFDLKQESAAIKPQDDEEEYSDLDDFREEELQPISASKQEPLRDSQTERHRVSSDAPLDEPLSSFNKQGSAKKSGFLEAFNQASPFKQQQSEVLQESAPLMQESVSSDLKVTEGNKRVESRINAQEDDYEIEYSQE